MSGKPIKLGKSLVDTNSMPYVIAEVGVNHEGSMENALSLIDLAADAGANAVKFQTYKAHKLAAQDSPSYWDTSKESTTNQRELFAKYDNFLPADYERLAKHCERRSVDFCSTPFDSDAVEFLNPLVSFFKIASADLLNLPLLRQIAKKRKPVILSTGASDVWEIATAINELSRHGCDQVILLHCVLNYPTPIGSAHLGMIKGLQASFPNHLVGYSDHTLPDENMVSLATAFALGSCVIEKHFTSDKSLPGNDHYHAMDVNDLKTFMGIAKKMHSLCGNETTKRALDTEQDARQNARRSIVTAESLEAGHKIVESDLTSKRPASGIATLHWDRVIGKTVRRTLDSDHILQWDDLESPRS